MANTPNLDRYKKDMVAQVTKINGLDMKTIPTVEEVKKKVRYGFNDKCELETDFKDVLTQDRATIKEVLLERVGDMEIKGSWMEKAHIHNKALDDIKSIIEEVII